MITRRILVTIALMALAAPMLIAAGASQYKVDPVHSSVVFRIQHLGLGYIYGRFNTFDGSVVFDPDKPADSAFNVTVRADSVDTANAKRDEHLRGSDFFGAKQFPHITFKSTKVEPAGDGKLKVTGDLTLHGVTRAVTADVEVIGHGDRGPMFGYRAGFAAQFTVNRSEFGMNFGVDNGMLGDEVTLMIGLETVRQ